MTILIQGSKTPERFLRSKKGTTQEETASAKIISLEKDPSEKKTITMIIKEEIIDGPVSHLRMTEEETIMSEEETMIDLTGIQVTIDQDKVPVMPRNLRFLLAS